MAGHESPRRARRHQEAPAVSSLAHPDRDIALGAGGRAAAACIRVAGWCLARAPVWLLDAVAKGLAGLWYHVVPVRRGVAEENVARSLPGCDATERRRIVRRVGYHLARNYLDFLALPFLSRERLEHTFVWEGREHLERARERGKGVLVLSAHIGAFDLLAAAVARQGWPLTIVSRTPRSNWVRAIWMGYREAAGVEILPERGSVFQVLRALSRGRLVALMLDQDVHADRGVFVDFFGRPACTSDSLAVLALRSGAPVVPVFTRRVAPDRHLVRCFPPISEHGVHGDRKTRVRLLTQAYTRRIEAEVREVPEQWLWLHRRWKTRPPDPTS